MALLCGWMLVPGCFLKQAFQVDPCLVPHSSSTGARPGLLRRLDGTAYMEPIVEDVLKAEYGGTCTISVTVPRRAPLGWFGLQTTETRCSLPTLDKTQRNNMIEEVLTRCDMICANHKSGFVAQDILQRLGFGMAGVGLSAAGAVVTGGVSQALSAASTGVQGAGSEVSKDVYNEKVGAAIANAIDADQIAKKTNIRLRQKETVASYPVYAGLDDVQTYHQSCSFSAGLDLVQKEVGTAREDAEKDYRKSIVTSAVFQEDDASITIQTFVDKTEDGANERALREWMRANGLADISTTLFMFGDKYADARAKAVSALKLK